MKAYALFSTAALLLFLPNAALADNEKFAKLSEQFMYESLARSPNLATGSGYHKHVDDKSGKTIELDSELDDFSLGWMQDQLKFFQNWRQKFVSELDIEKLDEQDAADWKLIDGQIASNLLEYGSIKTYLYNPSLVGTVIASSLIQPLRAPQATVDQRQENVISRLKKVPRILEQVKKYLHAPPQFLINSALAQNENVLGVIQNTLPKYFPSPGKKAKFEEAAAQATEAVHEFSAWLKSDKCTPGAEDGWRLGKDLYEKKFACTLRCSATPAQILEEAEEQLKIVRADMLKIAEPLYKNSAKEKLNETEMERQNRIIGGVLNKISLEHPNRSDFVKTIERSLSDIKKFVEKNKIVSLNKRQNLRVVPVSGYAHWHTIAGLNSAPPLEPQSVADFWVMPIDPGMPAEKAESLLREYNNYTLKWLVIHEALPGHYIQAEHLNDLLPMHRRLLRALFRNDAYVEGWAEYIAQVMLDEGFMSDDPKFRLTARKIRLRLLANTILDIKMHTTKMTDEEALDFMMKDAFQTEAEARNKLNRVKSTSCHLPSYYVGLREWQKLRQKYQAAKGKDFDQLEFHNKALDQGPLPFPLLDGLLL